MVWRQKPQPNPGAVQLLASTVTKDPLLAQLLVARGIDSFDAAKSFFRPSLNYLHDPYRMKDMERAVERIEKARLQQEHVMIYGDYDVDGTTSVALMCDFLEGKFPIEAYIPDRYKEGYGLSFDGINLAAELGVTLLIALDCGIKAFDQIAHAKSLGIDIIVCDHHRPEEELPKAHAILDPKRPDCLYPLQRTLCLRCRLQTLSSSLRTLGATPRTLPLSAFRPMCRFHCSGYRSCHRGK